MKTKFIPTRKTPLYLLLILIFCILPMKLVAQNNSDQDAKDEGIVLYSDTSGITTNHDYQQPDTSSYQYNSTSSNSLWKTMIFGNLDEKSETDDLIHPLRSISHFFSGLLGIGLFLGIILVFLAIVIPLALIIGLIVLIIYLTRPTPRTGKPNEPPFTPEEIKECQKLQIIRLASIGVALLLVEWLFGMAYISGTVGVVLLCIAGGLWLGRNR